MTARDTILDALRRNRPDPGSHPLPPPATLGDLDAGRERFVASLRLLGGDVMERAAGEPLAAAIARHFPAARMICAAVPGVDGAIPVQDLPDARAADPVDVAVVRAAFGIAETGSIFLSEAQLHLNALAHLAQHLVVLLDPAQLTANLHTAYRRPEFRTARYGVLMSGPSATADIQGVLIRGAQGVRSLSVCFDPS
ncbi:LutC/YkgG family protein [Gluconacetobacter tumulisoli]|uniref:LUD domain-containing protein n=1 Tax=Gluconacetobacter tumulisoli TaxID=1286189 RepID=A0A7W4K417_9PROT|nr:LUD domain-containing protein [Gluconacetobacter tumulisoli]MBB2199994.1 LUD domain-containing protein [Gluconacetobacter tumulisoli]